MNEHAAQHDPWECALLWAVRVPAFGALAISVFLFYESLAGGPALPGCGPGSGCDAVLSSRWAYWLGTPVAGPAMGVYTLLLAMSWQVGRHRPLEQRRLAGVVMAAAALAAAGAAVWFIALQVGVLGQLCVYCTTAHGLGLLAAGLTAALIRRSGMLGGRQLAVPAIAGALALATLIGGQVAVAPPTVHVERGWGIVGDTGPAAAPGERELSIARGESGVRLTPHDQPVLGSADADLLLVYLYDYTCAHCRVMHRQLDVVRQRAGGRLGIVMLPVPLDAACHPLYEQTPPPHVDACELARLALAVWHADAAQFEAFDHWMTEAEETRSLEAAREQAAALVGAEALATALAEPWVQEQPERNAAMHLLGGAGPLPQLVGPRLWMQGRPATAEALWDDLANPLGLEPTEP